MDTRAKHLLVELWQCQPGALDDLDGLRALMLRAASAAGATVVGEAFHRYAPQGVTGVLLLEESHFSLHTWPESGYAAFDFYTCGALDPEPAARVVAEGLGGAKVTLLEVDRGQRGETESVGALSIARRSSW